MHEHNTTPPTLDRYDATHIHTGRWRIALLEARFRTSSRPSADERRLLENTFANLKAECANVNAEARVASHGVSRCLGGVACQITTVGIGCWATIFTVHLLI